jgi:hypothetical protein
MAFEIGPQIRYAPDGQRTYNKNGELVTHHGYFETLADQLASFTRASVAYKQDGTAVVAGQSRYEEVNIALGKTVTGNGNTTDIERVADGNTATAYYYNAGSGESYVQVDLGAVSNLKKIVVWHYYSDNRTYHNTKTQISEDEIDWITVFDSGVSGEYAETSEGHTIELIPTKARYIRDYANGSTSNTSNHWVEIQAFSAFGQALMVEEGTTNFLRYSEDFTQSIWGKSQLTVTPNNVFAPDGSTTADKLTPNSINGNITQLYTVDPANKTFTFSIWLRADVSHYTLIKIQNNDYTEAQDKVVFVTTAWQKFEVTKAFSLTGKTSVVVLIWPGDYNGTTDPVYAWGAQLEQKAYPTSYMATEGITTTRVGETLNIPTTGVLTTQTGTIDCWIYVSEAIKTPYNHYIFSHVTDLVSPYANVIALRRTSSGSWQAWLEDNNGNSSSVGVIDTLTVGWHHFAIKWDSRELALFVDGIKVNSAFNPYLPSQLAAYFYIGSWSGSMQMNALISDLRISMVARSDSDIAAAYATGLPLTVDEYTTYLMSCNGTLQPTIRGFGLWSKNGRHILHDPQSGQGIEVWDDNSLKVLIGLLANGKIGIKTNNGEIYSGKFQTGNENSNTYIALNSDGTLSTYYNGKQNLGMWPNQSWGNIEFYEDGNSTGQLYASNENDPVLGGTRRKFVVWSKGDGSLKLDGPGIELDSDYVRLASSTSAQITVRGKIRDNLLPAYDSNGYVGQEELRWNTVRARYITSGDLCFEEGSCPICEQPFAPGDTIVLAVQHIHEEHHTMCIPIHDRCKGVPKTITVEVPETEKRYKLGKDGQIEVYHTTKFQEVEEQVHKIKDDYSIDEKTREFKKNAVDQPATKDEAVEVVTVKKRVPVMKTVKVELNVTANT